MCLVVCFFVHLVSQQSANPCLDVAFGDQHNDWFIVTAPLHFLVLERL